MTEPYYRSLETTRRLARLAAELPIGRVAAVANKVRSSDERDAIAEFCSDHGIELAASLPWSDDVTEADRAGAWLLDHAPDSPVVAAITGLVHATTLTAPA